MSVNFEMKSSKMEEFFSICFSPKQRYQIAIEGLRTIVFVITTNDKCIDKLLRNIMFRASYVNLSNEKPYRKSQFILQ